MLSFFMMVDTGYVKFFMMVDTGYVKFFYDV